jgi:hypothetical protein
VEEDASRAVPTYLLEDVVEGAGGVELVPPVVAQLLELDHSPELLWRQRRPHTHTRTPNDQRDASISATRLLHVQIHEMPLEAIN